MDIGTAKPSLEERASVKHHMIDVVEPWESYSAGRYIEEVKPVIARLHDRNGVPLIVGGTGLYIKAMTRGIFRGPSADKELRDELIQKETDEPGSLYRQLQSVDPETASTIMPADTRRIIRALEVCLSGEKTMSEMRAEHTERLPYDFIKIGLTRDRKELYTMIDRRVDEMMERGLPDEVKRIAAAIREHYIGPITGISSMQAIGYKELLQYFEGNLSLPEAVELIKQRSRNYAKRQFTWFRKEEGIEWIDITGLLDSGKIFGKIMDAIEIKDRH